MELRRALERAAVGHPDAQGWLFGRYKGPVYRFAMSRHRLDPDQASEVVQRTFIRAFDGLHRLRDHGAFEVWLWRIARREALRLVLRAQRGEVDLEEALDVACDRDEQQAVERERERLLEQIHRALARLAPGPVKDTAESYYLAPEAVTTVELAAALGVPEATVRKRLFTFRNQLRAELEEDLRGGP